MDKKLKAISKVSLALALLGAAAPVTGTAPTSMAAKKATKKAKKSTKMIGTMKHESLLLTIHQFQ